MGRKFQALPLYARRQFAVAQVDPRQAFLDQFLVDTYVFNPHKCHGPAVTVGCDGFHLGYFSEYQVRGKLLCFFAEGLALLGTIDSVQADLLRVVMVKDSSGVSIADADYLASPCPGKARCVFQSKSVIGGQTKPTIAVLDA